MSDQEPASPDLSNPNPSNAFLNIPYDTKFESLYLAYIAGVTAYGLVPRATLEVPGGERRLDRIFELIRSCRYSFHDLSRVELDPRRPPTPRFNEEDFFMVSDPPRPLAISRYRRCSPSRA